MGTLTVQQMAEEVWFATGQRDEVDPSTTAGLAILTQRIRDAYRHVCSAKVFDHPALHNLQQDFTAGAGTAEGQNAESFALPTRLRAIEFVRDETSGYRLEPDRFDEFMNRGAAARRYARRGQRIYLSTSTETAGHTIRVHYWGAPAALADASSTTEISDEWDQIIVTLATSLTFGRLGQVALADYHQSIAAAMIEDQVGNVALEAGNAGWQNDLSDTDPYQPRS